VVGGVLGGPCIGVVSGCAERAFGPVWFIRAQ